MRKRSWPSVKQEEHFRQREQSEEKPYSGNKPDVFMDRKKVSMVRTF